MSEKEDLIAQVSPSLGLHDAWQQKLPPGEYSQKVTEDRVRDIHYELGVAQRGAQNLLADQALEETMVFLDRNFGAYEGKIKLPERDWAFFAPTRPGDEEETTQFLPMLSSDFGVSQEARQHVVASLAPGVIEEYQGIDGGVQGAIVHVPINWNERGRGAVEDINAAAMFARRKLGVRAIGLGAILPLFSRLGSTVNVEGLTTTTGHGGTVHFVAETVGAVIDDKSERNEAVKSIGVIGAAGSIGGSSVELILQKFDGHMINVYDKHKPSELAGMVDRDSWRGRTRQLVDGLDVLRLSDIIVAAVTDTIDLDIVDPELSLDLSGKVIIDDSQPGYFNREQVEARGGKLIWVVGQDKSEMKPLLRENGFHFGNTSGLVNPNDVFGCEAEVYALIQAGRLDLAVRQLVTPEIALSVGALIKSSGIEVAPFQSYSKVVDLGSRAA